MNTLCLEKCAGGPAGEGSAERLAVQRIIFPSSSDFAGFVPVIRMMEMARQKGKHHGPISCWTVSLPGFGGGLLPWLVGSDLGRGA